MYVRIHNTKFIKTLYLNFLGRTKELAVRITYKQLVIGKV